MSKILRLFVLMAAMTALVACSGGGKKVTRIESDSVTDLSGNGTIQTPVSLQKK